MINSLVNGLVPFSLYRLLIQKYLLQRALKPNELHYTSCYNLLTCVPVLITACLMRFLIREYKYR